MFRGKIRRIHFVGIGGTGMSGIAEVLLNMGYPVSGSDMRDSATVARLRELGGVIHLGHSARNVQKVDVVVKSTAVANSNPEIAAALEAGIPVIPRAEMLAELMRMKYGVAVAGTHGKTTTTSMIATCLHQAGLDPTVVIGGRLNSMGSSARLGTGEYMVAEADESDGSFMMLPPTVAVITNIDPEHMSHWNTHKALVDGFFDFASKVPFFGFAVLCIDHPTVRTLVPWMRRRVVTYGLSEDATVRGEPLGADGLRSRFRATRGAQVLGEIELGMPGRHNIANALAAVAVALELDVPFPTIQQALHGFTGVDRRFSVRGEVVGAAAGPGPGGEATPITVVDDYGHHPIEIAATLAAARDAWPTRRLVAVLQPHRYSRVADHFQEFCRCLEQADEVVVCPIYAAGEKSIPRIHHHRLLDGIRAQQRASSTARAVESLDEALEHLVQTLKPGDVVLTLGAGDITGLCTPLLRRLREAHEPR